MSEDWSAVAAEVAEAIASVGDVSQPQGCPATLRKMTAGGGDPWNPGDPTPTDTTLRVVETINQKRDRDGALIGEPRRTLLVAVSGVVPSDDDTIAVGIEAADVASDTVFENIIEVRPLSPAGVDLLYEIDLAI